MRADRRSGGRVDNGRVMYVIGYKPGTSGAMGLLYVGPIYVVVLLDRNL